MADQANQQRDEAEREIVDKAGTDHAFRQKLLSNPPAALEGVLGSALPPNVEISVVEETPSHYYLVLPPAGVAAGAELSDHQLGAVAGGGFMEDTWNDETCVSDSRCWWPH